MHIGCLVEKVLNHIVFIWAIRFIVKLVKQISLEVFITRKVVGFCAILHLFRLQKHQHASHNTVYHRHFYSVLHNLTFSKRKTSLKTSWVSLTLYLKPPLLNSLHQMVIIGFLEQCIWIQLEKGWDAVKLGVGEEG